MASADVVLMTFDEAAAHWEVDKSALAGMKQSDDDGEEAMRSYPSHIDRSTP